ncbi:dipeptide/oligopeptide/nickel ABC transporter ATP-binding protein [uncultured Ruegeria sp.]|uniref:ABC transporter ATP-binding protein n=1 Tax=uncultured Ruegeria sp. TaxID=259304 RepID=UPI00260822F1|nr:dipeptide/oligopeptide/nickel ABC transporter ATP-binding protein [uncultured Ruegeria sp.]
MTNAIVEVSDLVIRYSKGSFFSAPPKPAVDGVSFALEQGKTLGIVGESGSGKSTVLKSILRLIPTESGHIKLDGQDWLAIRGTEMRKQRARIGVVSQNPFLSLSPRLSIAKILAEPMVASGDLSQSEIADRSEMLLGQCGLPADYLKRRARELSGGQAQRVAVARALALEPTLMILDEPTSALDVSVQAQILNLLDELKESLGLSMLMVTHDLGVVQHTSDNLLVMRHGEQIEFGLTYEIVANPAHEYTEQLINA